MASSSDPSIREGAVRKQSNGPPFKFLVPLVYAPVLPLIRISLRRNPVVRDRLFMAVLAGAFAHGFYLVYPFPNLLAEFNKVITILPLKWGFGKEKFETICPRIETDLYDIESK